MRALSIVCLISMALQGCTPTDGPPVVGRYWARLEAKASVSGTAWFEYQRVSDSLWSSTPVRTSTREDPYVEWLVGLQPDTEYRFQFCELATGQAPRCTAPSTLKTTAPAELPWIRVDPQVPNQLQTVDGARFIVWGNNYVGPTNDDPNDLVEDIFHEEAGFEVIAQDLDRLVNLAPPNGRSNVIRMHLQLHEFLRDAQTPNRGALARYARVIELAEDRGLYVMVTGLNYFFPADNPRWIAEQTDEAAHWETQAIWWNAMAAALRYSPGAFAFDLMNEPYVSGGRVDENGLARYTTVGSDEYCDYGADPEKGIKGTCFGQYVTVAPLNGRTAGEVAGQWVSKMRDAIRAAETDTSVPGHLITVGVGAFGMNNPFNASPLAHAPQDFLSPHLYPDGEDAQATIDLAARIDAITDKPIIAGETFTFGDVRRLLANTCHAGTVQGWIGQYDGRVLGDTCPAGRNPFGCALYDAWYEVQADYGPAFREGTCPAEIP